MTDLSIQMMARVQRPGREGVLGTNYKRGPQGNEIIDYRADYLDRYGPAPKGEIPSTVEDKRDNRDPALVGTEYLASRASGGNGHRMEINDKFARPTVEYKVGDPYPKDE